MMREPRRIPAGEHPMQRPILCVLTRCRLRRLRDLLPVYLYFRRIHRQLQTSPLPGFIHAALPFEGFQTVYFLSFWESQAAIARFGTAIPEHIFAVRRLFARAARTPDGLPEIWSTKWTLTAVSNNLHWQGINWWALINAAEPSPIFRPPVEE